MYRNSIYHCQVCGQLILYRWDVLSKTDKDEIVADFDDVSKMLWAKCGNFWHWASPTAGKGPTHGTNH